MDAQTSIFGQGLAQEAGREPGTRKQSSMLSPFGNAVQFLPQVRRG